MDEIIKDIRKRRLEDVERVHVLRGGLFPRQRFECKKKQLLQYHRGRVRAFQDAIALIKEATRELAIAEKVDRAYVGRVLNLTLMPPKEVEALVG